MMDNRTISRRTRYIAHVPMKPRALYPYPNGWFTVALSSELPRGKVLTRQFMGGEVVLYRTQDGHVCAVDPYCAHLGAHLGYGGTVVGENIRCPFHGFCFDRSGVCVATGYGTKPPPKARLKSWTVREINGLVMLHHDCEPPTWDVPALDTEGWTPLIHQTVRLNEHAQETVENSVDLGHFAIVHNYRNVRLTRDIHTDGAYMNIGYAATRPIPRLSAFSFDVEYDLHIYGLGYSLVQVTVPGFGIHSRLFILATPVNDDYIDLIMALSVRERFDHPLLRVMPSALLSRVIARGILGGLMHDASQDFPIWQNKRYVDPPALAEGDGPIGRFRIWARQFYTREGDPAGS